MYNHKVPTEKGQESQRRNVGAFTLFELLIALLIISVVVALALPNFYVFKERSLGKEAKTQLKLIAGAEKSYRWDSGSFYPYDGSNVTDVDSINRNLALSINNRSWDFTIRGNQTTFNATADRKGTGGYLDCNYALNYSVNAANNPEDPTANSASACP